MFLWHHVHTNYKDALFAKQLLVSLETAGKIVFPDSKTGWYSDDKLGEKYLLEAIHAPVIPTHVFFSKKEALIWANKANYPIVFKLRGGAGSANVKLLYNKKSAIRIINKSFGRGISQFDRWGYFKERYRKYREGKSSFKGVLVGIYRLFFTTQYNRMHPKEKGYVYFQDFMPNNSYDTRITVIGEKAFGFQRGVRRNDFRASGSGDIRYDVEIDPRMIRISFEIAKKLNSQVTAFDFIYDINNNPLIVEVTFGFNPDAVNKCKGYWDRELNWHYDSQINISALIMKNILDKVANQV